MVGILALDESQQLLLVNHAAKEMLDITGRPTPGRPLVELIRNPKIISLIQEVQDSGRLCELEVDTNAIRSPIQRQSINQILRLRASPLTADGAAPGVLLLISDETRLRRLEAMRRDFTANVSHELKTPLAAIRAYAETLLMGALEDPDANRRFVQNISHQAERLDELIHDLLRLARLQSEPDGVSTIPIAIIPILEQSISQHRAIGLSKEISIDFPKPTFTQPSDNWFVMGDEEALITIFNNLLGNAIRYTQRGGQVHVHIDPQPNQLVISVRDNGIGIPEEDHERIFERFYRVEKARSSDTGGTGLGLAIVKNLVVAIGGTVTIESEVGRGSCFTVSLVRHTPDLQSSV
jgi:two-component system phosphate regulon sensor histidine kinase PhoR